MFAAVDAEAALAALYRDDERAADCRCSATGYCPVHGGYTPAVVDLEVAEAVYDARRRAGSGRRVVRKPLEK